MKKTFKISAAAFAVFALCGAAHASEVHIALDGKNAETVHAEIVNAAYKVCQEPDALGLNEDTQSECVAATIAKATFAYRRAVAQSATQVARAQITSTRTGPRTGE